MSVATASHSQAIRESLHLSIDPPPYSSSPIQFSPDSPYTSSSSARPSSDTAGTSPLSSGSDSIIYSVLCMHDFLSDDPTHLSFYRNEILDIFKQEESGWWAAMRRGGDIIGWIPQAFVKPLEEEMAERLLNVREELRIYEYEAEQLYVTAPMTRIPYEGPEPVLYLPPATFLEGNAYQNTSDPRRSSRPYPPPSPATPMPQPPPPNILPKFSTNKPTPPTPKEQEVSFPQDRGTPLSATRRPLPPLTTSSEDSVRNDPSVSPDTKRRDEKIKKLTGSDEALAFLNALNPPWYLKPRHTDEIQIDAEGKLISGTRIALVERLVWDIIPSAKILRHNAQDNYRRMFLTTFRTFMTPDDLFDVLVDMYRMSYPESLTESEFHEWRDRCLQPTQRQILTIFTMWLEEYKLLEEEPYISRRLIEFLELIKLPNPLAATAQEIIKTITRLTFETTPPIVASPTNRRRKHKLLKNDILSLQPSDVAEQLALYEFKFFVKIKAQDCITQASQGTKTSGCTRSREALTAFCATHDKVAAWVTDTILNCHLLSRRSDTVDFWIKVAEKCRNLNNFASMSAIINALSSTVINRLNLTWVHVSRKNTFEALLKYNEPSGGFSAYRQLHLHAVDAPCVPFIGMYLTELVHIKDQYSDEGGRVSVLQRQRWYDVVMIMLRSQARPYNITENDTMKFIQDNLRGWTATNDWQSKFWSKSQEVQRSEREHADIRKGLERAGF